MNDVRVPLLSDIAPPPSRGSMLVRHSWKNLKRSISSSTHRSQYSQTLDTDLRPFKRQKSNAMTAQPFPPSMALLSMPYDSIPEHMPAPVAEQKSHNKKNIASSVFAKFTRNSFGHRKKSSSHSSDHKDWSTTMSSTVSPIFTFFPAERPAPRRPQRPSPESCPLDIDLNPAMSFSEIVLPVKEDIATNGQSIILPNPDLRADLLQENMSDMRFAVEQRFEAETCSNHSQSKPGPYESAFSLERYRTPKPVANSADASPVISKTPSPRRDRIDRFKLGHWYGEISIANHNPSLSTLPTTASKLALQPSPLRPTRRINTLPVPSIPARASSRLISAPARFFIDRPGTIDSHPSCKPTSARSSVYTNVSVREPVSRSPTIAAVRSDITSNGPSAQLAKIELDERLASAAAGQDGFACYKYIVGTPVYKLYDESVYGQDDLPDTTTSADGLLRTQRRMQKQKSESSHTISATNTRYDRACNSKLGTSDGFQRACLDKSSEDSPRSAVVDDIDALRQSSETITGQKSRNAPGVLRDYSRASCDLFTMGEDDEDEDVEMSDLQARFAAHRVAGSHADTSTRHKQQASFDSGYATRSPATNASLIRNISSCTGTSIHTEPEALDLEREAILWKGMVVPVLRKGDRYFEAPCTNPNCMEHGLRRETLCLDRF